MRTLSHALALLAAVAVLGATPARADDPLPPSPAERAQIAAEVERKAIAVALEYRQRVRLGAWVGALRALDTELPSGDCEPVWGPEYFFSAAVGMRYALASWLDLQARTGVLGPLGSRSDSAFAWTLEASARLRPIVLVPFYVGVGPSLTVASASSGFCLEEDVTRSEVSALFGVVIDTGVDFGAEEQFELGLRTTLDAGPHGAALSRFELVFGMVFL